MEKEKEKLVFLNVVYMAIHKCTWPVPKISESWQNLLALAVLVEEL